MKTLEKKSIRDCYEEIKRREINELKETVQTKAPYRLEFDEGKRPRVCVFYDEGSTDVYVSAVEIYHNKIHNFDDVIILDTTGRIIDNDSIPYGEILNITEWINEGCGYNADSRDRFRSAKKSQQIKGQTALAKELGVTQQTISLWQRQGKFEGCFVRIGKTYTYNLDAVLKKFTG